jgi:hypothetical protein
MLDSFLPPKIVVATQELVVGVRTSLVETKHANFVAKLVAKHCILTMVISVGASSIIAMARVLGVHHQNVSKAIVHQAFTCDTGVPLWTLSVRKKRNADNPHVIRNLVVNWWATKTQISPNKSNVTRKKLEARILDEKPTHFLMET